MEAEGRQKADGRETCRQGDKETETPVDMETPGCHQKKNVSLFVLLPIGFMAGDDLGAGG